jgi:hypothetical protein
MCSICYSHTYVHSHSTSYIHYFTAVTIFPPPVSTLPFYNNLLQQDPLLPLHPLYCLSSPV